MALLGNFSTEVYAQTITAEQAYAEAKKAKEISIEAKVIAKRAYRASSNLLLQFQELHAEVIELENLVALLQSQTTSTDISFSYSLSQINFPLPESAPQSGPSIILTETMLPTNTAVNVEAQQKVLMTSVALVSVSYRYVIFNPCYRKSNENTLRYLGGIPSWIKTTTAVTQQVTIQHLFQFNEPGEYFVGICAGVIPTTPQYAYPVIINNGSTSAIILR